jgi:hypothetical protein
VPIITPSSVYISVSKLLCGFSYSSNVGIKPKFPFEIFTNRTIAIKKGKRIMDQIRMRFFKLTADVFSIPDCLVVFLRN